MCRQGRYECKNQNCKRKGRYKMAVDKSLVSGSTMMLILKLLEEKDMYGYEMIETLREKSENVFELKAGTLYPLLHGLEEKEFVKSYEQEAGGKIRKYYSITREGKKQLRAKEKEWKEYAGAVRNVLGGVCFG
jgi:PadR family transcriptional regulator PadR